MALYCALSDVYAVLSARAFESRPRPVEATDTATGLIRLTAHGTDALDLVAPSAVSGGSLPTGLSAFTLYTPVPYGADLLRLAPVGGSAITSYASAGSGWSLKVDVERRILRLAAFECARIDESLTAQAPPVEPDPVTGLYPMILVALAARMTARAACVSLQMENPAYRVAVDRLFAQEKSDEAMMAAWKAGRPIHPQVTDQTSYGDNSPRASTAGGADVSWITGAM